VNDQPAVTPDGTGRGDRAAAFARYVEPEIAVLYRVALTLAGQRADADDLVQEALIRAYRAVDRFDGAHPRAWLLTILRNTHRNRLRIRVASPLHENEQDTGLLDRSDPARSVQLVDVDGLTYAEAAEALGVPRGTVMSRLHRARARIRLVAAGLVPHRSRP